MKCYVICCTVTSPDNTSILILAGAPSKGVNACLRLDGRLGEATPSDLYNFLPYHSTYSGQRGATCSCTVSISPQGGYIFRYECAIYFTHLPTLFFTI